MPCLVHDDQDAYDSSQHSPDSGMGVVKSCCHRLSREVELAITMVWEPCLTTSIAATGTLHISGGLFALAVVASVVSDSRWAMPAGQLACGKTWCLQQNKYLEEMS